jgi:hypothetical protein
VSPAAGLNDVEHSNSGPSAVQPVASNCTDCAIPAHVLFLIFNYIQFGIMRKQKCSMNFRYDLLHVQICNCPVRILINTSPIVRFTFPPDNAGIVRLHSHPLHSTPSFSNQPTIRRRRHSLDWKRRLNYKYEASNAAPTRDPYFKDLLTYSRS